jgi:hypothetical protein
MAAFESAERRHGPLAARQRTYNTSPQSWRGMSRIDANATSANTN